MKTPIQRINEAIKLAEKKYPLIDNDENSELINDLNGEIKTKRRKFVKKYIANINN